MPESNSPSNRASSARSDPIGSNRSPKGSKNARVSSTSRLRKRNRSSHGGPGEGILPPNLLIEEFYHGVGGIGRVCGPHFPDFLRLSDNRAYYDSCALWIGVADRG